MSQKEKIAVGMSGGVDSAMAAVLLREQGHTVLGVTARMHDECPQRFEMDVERARAVAGVLGIRHVVVDAREMFQREVLDPFLAEYHAGRTPSPCVLCNPRIKFGHLLMKTRQLGCARLATGHYARVVLRDGIFHLLKGHDARKDQSYFLHRLSQEQLACVVFPLAEWTKEQVVSALAARGVQLPPRNESQDLCFLTEGNYAAYVERHFPGLRRKGCVVDAAGRPLGTHMGHHRYTIGQREGLGVASTERLYVKEIRPVENEVVLGTRAEVMRPDCVLTDMHWIAVEAEEDAAWTVRLRYRQAGVPCRIERLPGRRIRVTFLESQFAVAPGQAGVLYAGDEVLGGGWIE